MKIEQEILEKIWKGNPEWLREKRENALKIFQESNFPVWKRLKLDLNFWNGLKIDFVNLTKPGFFIKRKSSSTESFIFTDISDALKNYPDLVKESIEKIEIHDQEKKLMSLLWLLWRSGNFLFVPESSKLKEPIFSCTRADSDIFSFNLIIGKKNSEFVYLDESRARNSNKTGFRNSLTVVFLDEGAKAKLIHIQNLGEKYLNVFYGKSFLGNNSSILWNLEEIGSEISSINVQSNLNGTNSKANLTSMFISKQNQKIDHLYEAIHSGPGTESSIRVKGSIFDESMAIYRANAHIKKGARKSKVSQKGDILLLGEKAKADAIPSLWIEEDDCQASHGASVAPLNFQKVFYMITRGLEKREAKKLLIRGFYDSLIRNVEDDRIISRMERVIEKRLTDVQF
ncbi:MAG: SufD family Fe-S cluster assembly protein [Acidobacteriota bacterium]